MTEQKKVERKGAGAAETSHIAADPAPARRRRLTAARKQEAVLCVLRGNVYDSPTGSLLLIPEGARIIGQYDASVSFGHRQGRRALHTARRRSQTRHGRREPPDPRHPRRCTGQDQRCRTADRSAPAAGHAHPTIRPGLPMRVIVTRDLILEPHSSNL